MMKIFLSLISWLSPTSFLINSNIAYNNSVINRNVNKINTSNAMWGGLALSYFIYKHSDMDINNEWDSLLNNLNFEGKSNVQNKESASIFKQELISSAVNVSMYGMTSYREFFAEAHTKWISTPKKARNISWEIIDYFFRIIMPQLINDYDGDILMNVNSEGEIFTQNKFDNIKKLIDDDFNKSNSKYVVKSNTLIYKTIDGLVPTSQKLSLSDLEYNSESFGYFNTKEKNKISRYIITGTLISFKHALAAEYETNYSNYGLDITLGKDKGDKENSDDQLINFWQNENNQLNIVKSITNFSSLQNYTYKKADDAASDDFDNYNSYLKTVYSKDFNNLSNKMAKNTNNNIDLKSNIEGISYKRNFTNDLKYKMEELILTTYNLDSDLTTMGNKYNKYNNNSNILDYFLTNLVFADTDVIGGSKNTMAYTSVSMTSISSVNNNYVTSIYGYIIFKGDSFNSNIDQYQSSWWSSPNGFTTFSHEMGHLLDGFLGLYGSSKNLNNQSSLSPKLYLILNHKQILKSSSTKNVYKGKVFSDYVGSRINKKILYIVIPSVTISLLLISTLFYYNFRKNKKK